MEGCVHAAVLREIVRILELWLYDPTHSRYELTLTERVKLLLRMTLFGRISGPGSQKLRSASLNLIFKIFGGYGKEKRRPDLVPKLERCFMAGLKSQEPQLRLKFFNLYHSSVKRDPVGRLNYILSKQDWEHLAESLWIRQAVQLLLAIVARSDPIVSSDANLKFPSLVTRDAPGFQISDEDLPEKMKGDRVVADFIKDVESVTTGFAVDALSELCYYDYSAADTE